MMMYLAIVLANELDNDSSLDNNIIDLIVLVFYVSIKFFYLHVVNYIYNKKRFEVLLLHRCSNDDFTKYV